jgi:hypothetical protein
LALLFAAAGSQAHGFGKVVTIGEVNNHYYRGTDGSEKSICLFGEINPLVRRNQSAGSENQSAFGRL